MAAKLAAHLAEAELDRAWETERQLYLLKGKHGTLHVPTAKAGGQAKVAAVIVGSLFTFFFSIPAMIDAGQSPLFVLALLFPLAGVAFGIYMFRLGNYVIVQAEKYDRAYAAYQARRAKAAHPAAAVANQASDNPFVFKT